VNARFAGHEIKFFTARDMSAFDRLRANNVLHGFPLNMTFTDVDSVLVLLHTPL